MSFYYGQNHQRYETIYQGSIGAEFTYHVGKLLEKVANNGVLDYRHYIFAGGELVAIYSRMSSGTNSVHYILGDNQSSFANILTSTGTLDVPESFDAYGNRRSGETWSGAPSGPDETAINSVSRWGYTGQTVLGVSFGLNHMNGRVQDAITGRFLSPDPYVPDPGNTQSFNRYSYVNNNPLSLIDPSGFDGTSTCDDCGTWIVQGYNYTIDALGSAGSALGDIFSSIWHSIFGGGGAKFNGPHGINRSIPLQGAAAFAAGSDGQFKITLDAASATQGPQVAAAAAATPDSLQEITVTSERAPTLQEFAAQTAIDIAYNQSLLNQSAHLTYSSPTPVSAVLENYGRELVPVALTIASFIPVTSIEARLGLAAGEVTAESSVLARASQAGFRAAGRADEFALGAKHAAGAGGGWAKFAEGVNPNAALREALSSPAARILPNDANSFRVVTDLGRAIGSKGETGVRAVVDFEGHVVTWFPVKP